MTTLLQLARSAAPSDADRDKILDAARSAFLDFGIRRTSMGQIARRAGSSPATLHRRFGQKSEIVFSLMLREVRLFLDEVDRGVDRSGSAEDQVAHLAFFVFTHLREHELLRRLIATEPDDVLPLLTTEADTVLALGTEFLKEFIARLQDEGKLETFDPTPVAELMARVAHSFALTPTTQIPLDAKAFEAFARRHVVGLLSYRIAPGT